MEKIFGDLIRGIIGFVSEKAEGAERLQAWQVVDSYLRQFNDYVQREIADQLKNSDQLIDSVVAKVIPIEKIQAVADPAKKEAKPEDKKV